MSVMIVVCSVARHEEGVSHSLPSFLQAQPLLYCYSRHHLCLGGVLGLPHHGSHGPQDGVSPCPRPFPPILVCQVPAMMNPIGVQVVCSGCHTIAVVVCKRMWSLALSHTSSVICS